MPQFMLTNVTLVRDAQTGPIRLFGDAVIAVAAYDGTGAPASIVLPHIPFHRRAGQDHVLVDSQPGVGHFGGGGVLVATFPRVPTALGWFVSLTLSPRGQGAAVAQQVGQALAGLAPVVPGAGSIVLGVAGAAAQFFGAIAGIAGTRTAGTWIDSETDAADLQRDWDQSKRHHKAHFGVHYEAP